MLASMTAVLEPNATAAESTVTLPAPYHFSVNEYMKMYEQEILNPNVRTELLQGEVCVMAAMNTAHYHAIRMLNGLLMRHYYMSGLADVVPQVPLTLNEYSQPEPDFALLHFDMPARIAVASDVLLVIEVSDSTLKFDQSRKLAEYASSNLPEYWIINLPARQLEVYRQPDGAAYQEKLLFLPDQPVQALFAPSIDLDWGTVLLPE
jgi:Uma2 family endonuclease